ncbi:MAG TPA: DNA repair protein RecO [Chitinophagales bacterium]|nr:DNA repair protein RecO [Chitinophagales bacterium]
MLQKTEGIVLKTLKYSESSVITKIFTREYGLNSFIIPGVRSSRNKSKGNLFQPLQILELDVYYHPQKSLLKLKEYRPGHIYTNLYTDMVRQSVTIFAIEVLTKCIHENEVNEKLYDYMRAFLLETDISSLSKSMMPHVFLLEMSNILGFMPYIEVPFLERSYFNLEAGVFEKNPSFAQVTLDKLESLLIFDFLDDQHDNFSKKDRLKVLEILLTYFKFHIPNFKQITSLDIIRQIFS